MSRIARNKPLSNTFIPPQVRKYSKKYILRLPLKSISDLSLSWLQLGPTRPKLLSDLEIADIEKQLLSLIDRPNSKKILIDLIINVIWSDGFNLLQLSQIDCQCIVDRPNIQSWISSTAFDSKGNEYSMSLEPQRFLEKLTVDLNPLFKVHIYIARHPHLPLIIIRIQVFDTQSFLPFSEKQSLSVRKTTISSRKPFFVGLPQNSSHIIHSPGSDLVSKIIIQSIERSVSTSNTQIKLKQDTNIPIKSIESLHILKGVSRFSCSLGCWNPYAENNVDKSPLSSLSGNIIGENSKQKLDNNTNEKEKQDIKRRKLANLRFTGSINKRNSQHFKDGKSIQIYETVRPPKKTLQELRKGRGENDASDVDNSDDDDDDDDDLFLDKNIRLQPFFTRQIENEFSTPVPIQFTQFTLNEAIHKHNKPDEFLNASLPNVNISLQGNDIYGGIYEFAVKNIADVKQIPGWLTGEEGSKSGQINKGRVIAYEKD